ncbi:MAG: biotin--[acetyl-CoA-carboxylase] ligase [Alphaproteobacteria bacterium]
MGANINYKLISFDKLSSTQTYAQNLIRSGKVSDRTIILANSQTAGHGRYRRTWVSKPGNLYVSFIYETEKRDPKLSYSVAVAIAETLISFGIMPTIKWPNDILIDGKKISGTLIEYAKDFVVVGIGINIKSNPNVRFYETTKVADFAPKISRDELLSALIKQMDIWTTRNFTSIKNRWLELAANLNKTITYRGRDAILCGLNDDGALILRCGNEYVMIYGDEISV